MALWSSTTVGYGSGVFQTRQVSPGGGTAAGRRARRRARRCVVAAFAAATVVLVGFDVFAVPARAQTAPSRPIDTSITDYVLFGFNSVNFKGSDMAGRGLIQGGNVGANAPTNGNDATINICANKHTTMSDFSQVVGGVVRLTSNCTFWDLFANQTIGSGGATLHSGPTPVTLPVVAEPPFPAINCNPSNPFTVVKGAPPATMTAGTYGDVEFQDGTTVTLGPGLYQMCNFHTGQNVTVHAAPGVVLQIAGNFDLRNGTMFGLDPPACSTWVFARGDGVGANDSTINLGKDSIVAGHFYTNAGKVNLGNGTQSFGTYWGRDIISDFDDNVEYCPPLGDFPVTKTISGPGAGSQDDIQINITCLPSPPNSSIPPFIIPAGSPAGAYTTVVTGVTVPAVCRATEGADGANPRAVLEPRSPSSTPDSLLCPDVGNSDIDPATGHLRSLPPATLDNFFDTTTSSTTSTTESTTTTTTTTSSSTTTTQPITVPTDVCVLPTVVTSTTSGPGGTPLARTGGGAHAAVAGLIVGAVGLLLVLASRWQERRHSA